MSTRTLALMVLVGFGLWIAGMPRSFDTSGLGGLAATDFSATLIGTSAVIGLAIAASAYVTIGLRQGRKLAFVAGAVLFIASASLAFALLAPLAANAALVAMAIAAAALAIEGRGRVRIDLIGSAIACVLMAVALGGPDAAPMPALLDTSGTVAGLLWLIAAAQELGSIQVESNRTHSPV